MMDSGSSKEIAGPGAVVIGEIHPVFSGEVPESVRIFKWLM